MLDLRDEITGFLKSEISSYADLVGVDLTLKQGTREERLDDIKAVQNFRHFMNILNRKVYGNSATRFGQRIAVIPVLERKNHRYHYHTVLRKPTKLEQTEFINLIVESWGKTRFGYREFFPHMQIDAGWVGYITKLKSQSDEIDWVNLHLEF